MTGAHKIKGSNYDASTSLHTHKEKTTTNGGSNHDGGIKRRTLKARSNDSSRRSNFAIPDSTTPHNSENTTTGNLTEPHTPHFQKSAAPSLCKSSLYPAQSWDDAKHY
jgi:hypothetical protein